MAKLIGVREMQDRVTTTFEKSISNRSFLTFLANFTKERIFNTVKQGYSMAGGEKHKLKPLSTGYKNYRKKFQEIHPVGTFFSPNRSNLTLTGQMLEALTFKVSQAKGIFEVFVKDSPRDPTPPISLRAIKEPPRMSNAEVAKEVADKGRPFLGLDSASMKRIRNEVLKDLRLQLRRSGLRK